MSNDRPALEMVTYALTRIPPAGRVDITTFSRSTATHPQLIHRLIALGVLKPEHDAGGALWFGPEQASALSRARRLRAGLGLSWASLLVVTDLLDRIADLERELRRTTAREAGSRPWN